MGSKGGNTAEDERCGRILIPPPSPRSIPSPHDGEVGRGSGRGDLKRARQFDGTSPSPQLPSTPPGRGPGVRARPVSSPRGRGLGVGSWSQCAPELAWRLPMKRLPRIFAVLLCEGCDGPSGKQRRDPSADPNRRGRGPGPRKIVRRPGDHQRPLLGTRQPQTGVRQSPARLSLRCPGGGDPGGSRSIPRRRMRNSVTCAQCSMLAGPW